MAAVDDTHSKSEQLLQQLGSWKFIADVNHDLLDEDPILKEFISFKIDIAQGFIEELQLWEELGNQSKCDYAIKNAQFFLKQAQVLVELILQDSFENSLPDQPEEFKFTKYARTPHQYVLNQTRDRLGLAQ